MQLASKEQGGSGVKLRDTHRATLPLEDVFGCRDERDRWASWFDCRRRNDLGGRLDAVARAFRKALEQGFTSFEGVRECPV
jgi:hypothetical protein